MSDAFVLNNTASTPVIPPKISRCPSCVPLNAVTLILREWVDPDCTRYLHTLAGMKGMSMEISFTFGSPITTSMITFFPTDERKYPLDNWLMDSCNCVPSLRYVLSGADNIPHEDEVA